MAPGGVNENEGHSWHRSPYGAAEYESAGGFGSGVGGPARARVNRAKEIKGFFDVSDKHYAAVNLSPVGCVGAPLSKHGVARTASCGFSEMSCRQVCVVWSVLLKRCKQSAAQSSFFVHAALMSPGSTRCCFAFHSLAAHYS
jgi:hypothetical protein